nr:unnamed protein product [Callosobruchus analis]
MQQNGYISQMNLPTTVGDDSSTIIDHIFKHFKCTPFLLKNCTTDHYPVLANFVYLNKSSSITDNTYLVPIMSRKLMKINL